MIILPTASLGELACHWCRRCEQAGVDFTQVYVESTVDIRVQDRDGVRHGVHLDLHAGIGLLVCHRGCWWYQAVPLSQSALLADWLSGVTGQSVAQSVSQPSPAVADPAHVEQAMTVATGVVEPAAYWQPVAALGVSLSVLADTTYRAYGVSDSTGRSVYGQRVGLRRRCLAGGGGATGSARWFGSTEPVGAAEVAARLAEQAAQQAIAAGRSRSLGTRKTPVVTAPGVGAALVHELIGHALEADNLANPDGYGQRLRTGTGLTSDGLTSGLNVVDDPAVPDGYGSLDHDDEGVAASPIQLVRQGVVTGRLSSLRTASDEHCNGRGRRASYRVPAIPRTTNTVVGLGPDDPRQLAEPGSTGLLYVPSLGAGRIDHRRGEFSFLAPDSVYLTPGGDRIPVRDATLRGNAVDTIGRLSGIAADAGGDNVTCTKQGQPVGIGLFSPTMRFEDLAWSSS